MNGIQPIHGEPTRWFVPSRTRKNYAFIVDSDYHGKWACGCEQFLVRGRECGHIRMVKNLTQSRKEAEAQQ